MTGRPLFVLPDPDSSPEPVRRALRARNETTLRGVCPLCGARGPNRAERRRLARSPGLHVGIVVHDDDCPAGDDVLHALLAEYRGRA